MSTTIAFSEISPNELYFIDGGINVFNTVATTGALCAVLSPICPPLTAVALVCGSYCLGYSIAQ